MTFHCGSYWIPGSYAPTLSEKRHPFFRPLKKEGLQGGASDKSRVVRPRHIHDPGIQQEPSSIPSMLASPTRKSNTAPGSRLLALSTSFGRPLCCGTALGQDSSSRTSGRSQAAYARHTDRAGACSFPLLLVPMLCG